MSFIPIATTTGKQGETRESFSATIFSSRGRRARARSGSNERAGLPREAWAEDFSILVHCHLCWDWVWQRPQQFLSRLSRRHKILFVETVGPDPKLGSPYAWFRQADGFPNVTILRIQFPVFQWRDGALVDRERRRIVQQALRSDWIAGQFDRPVQWFYDPMAVTAFAGHMNEIATVYDCMDELSKFKGAPAGIIEREQQLLARADVVFTGGRKMFESKRRYNDNCHFYGCGVDVAHFGSAREERTRIPDDLEAIRNASSKDERETAYASEERGRAARSGASPSSARIHGEHKVLGYFGVIDERIDYELLAKVADADPNWAVVMIGPAAKVDPNQFPRRANLHWLGGREYEDLPAYCKGFDVCLMPFAMNEHTEFINPTKSLEYMATGRVVVSSAVPDVISNFGSVVKVAHSHGDFIQLCRQQAAHPDQKAIERGLKLASDNSWESIVGKLEGQIRDVLVRKQSEVPAAA